ncbi:MAG TPA: ECF-type sigma factor [Thermoanaerobaculia bacterium]|jgi:RNA polymerase sigma factor (TIGR02999 family)|nr:ECF-type sigma factor [Thermoanaerobaculia bacterium]
MADTTDFTELLHEWGGGDASALGRLIPLVFDDLRAMARRHLARESSDHTLQPTALVNELYLRLIGQNRVQWQNRQQFFAIAATLMRRILVDYAKAKHAEKRGGGMVKVPLDDVDGAKLIAESHGTDLVALNEALEKLQQVSPRQSQIVDLHFVMGLSFDDVALALEISVTTVKRDWQMARRFLLREITRDLA